MPKKLKTCFLTARLLIIILEGYSALSFMRSLYPPENDVAPLITVTSERTQLLEYRRISATGHRLRA